MVDNDIKRIETPYTTQLKREFIGNKLVFVAKSMQHIKDCQNDLVHFAKSNNVNLILHHNFDHFLITKDGSINNMGETKSWQANIDLVDEIK